jgi:hypothetical protein
MIEPRARKCSHIARGELPKHSTLHWQSVPWEQNSTTYEWNEVIELCPYCGGLLRAALTNLKLEKTP